MAVWSKKTIILGLQTYGPYNAFDNKIIAKYLLRHSYKIYSRDRESIDYLKNQNFKVDISDNTDVAYLLPYKKVYIPNSDIEKIKVGINISGLLYLENDKADKLYGLKTNYIVYSERIIDWLLGQGKYEVYLIPHAGNEKDIQGSDMWACSKIKEKYPDCRIYEGFENPIDAKSVIAQMDIFLGARMHATIGAFSAKIFTIPFAYSRKFSGYYTQLGYPVLVDGCKEKTEAAIAKTITYIKNYEKYVDYSERGSKLAKAKLAAFYEELVCIIKEKYY